MKKFVLTSIFIFSFFCTSFAQSQLFFTDFAPTSSAVTVSPTVNMANTYVTGNGDWESWMTAPYYATFEMMDSLTIPALTFTENNAIKVKFGIHDSGRNIDVVVDGTVYGTLIAPSSDALNEVSLTFTPALVGSKEIVLRGTEGVIVIAEITVTDGTTTAVLDAASSKVYGSNASVIVKGAEGATLKIMNLQASVIAQSVITSQEETISLAAGLYLVSVNDVVTKVLVK